MYPADAETRAKIDDCLYFDATSFYDSFGKTVVWFPVVLKIVYSLGRQVVRKVL